MRDMIFNGGVLRIEFTREISFRDSVVMRWKMVTLITKWTDPDLSGEINAGVRVENGGAGFATEGCIRKTGDIGMRTDEGDCGGEWDNAFGGFYFATWPDVPCHTDSVDSLGICVRHLRHR